MSASPQHLALDAGKEGACEEASKRGNNKERDQNSLFSVQSRPDVGLFNCASTRIAFWHGRGRHLDPCVPFPRGLSVMLPSLPFLLFAGVAVPSPTLLPPFPWCERAPDWPFTLPALLLLAPPTLAAAPPDTPAPLARCSPSPFRLRMLSCSRLHRLRTASSERPGS
eukprot:1742914-Pleurochrysis_carterae.AAC.2